MAYITIDIVASAEFACIIIVPCFPVMPRLYLYWKQGFKKPEDLYSRYDLRSIHVSGPKPVYPEKQRQFSEESTKDFEVPPPVPPKSWLDLGGDREEAVSPVSDRSVSSTFDDTALADNY